MNKLFTIVNELDSESSLDFAGSCAAKMRNLRGAPRIVIQNDEKIKTKQIKFLFAKNENYFKKIDDKYFEIIEKEYIEEFLSELGIKVIFDLSRVSFLEDDEFFDFIPNKFKKNFNLHQRSEERKNFLQSNLKHLSGFQYSATQVIFEKLNSMWLSKWNNPETYLNEYDEQIINNIIDA